MHTHIDLEIIFMKKDKKKTDFLNNIFIFFMKILLKYYLRISVKWI